MINIWGVVFAPNCWPTLPEGSSRTAVGVAFLSFVSASAWGAGAGDPCLPGAEEIIESQTTPLAVYSFLKFLHIYRPSTVFLRMGNLD